MKYHLVTLGCQMNKSDSERVATVIERMGYRWTDAEEEANLLGVLACSVRQKSIDKVYAKIHKWNKWKNKRNLLTFVSGCVLPSDKEKFLLLFDLIFQMSELPQLPDMISQYGVVTPVKHLTKEEREHIETEAKTQTKKDNPGFSALQFNAGTAKIDNLKVARPEEKIKDFWQLKPHYQSVYEAFIPIQNGCDKFCTFCAVPYTRGREISRSSEEILEEMKSLVEQDYKSITLLGQNVNSYGLDKKGNEITFPELLRRIGEYGNSVKKEFWVYFTSPHPRDMTEEVLEVIASYKCLAKQIHLPLQSGDDKVLIRMNRKHSLAEYRRIMEAIRRILPQATVFTDIIVGFTGETDDQFKNTRVAMEEFKYNMAYIAKYSPRPGAASSRWDDDIPNEVKTSRLHILTDELTKHTLEYNKQYIGKTLKVLVTGNARKKGYLSAMTEGRIVLHFPSEDNNLIGKFALVKIHGATEFALDAEQVKEKMPEVVES